MIRIWEYAWFTSGLLDFKWKYKNKAANEPFVAFTHIVNAPIDSMLESNESSRSPSLSLLILSLYSIILASLLSHVKGGMIGRLLLFDKKRLPLESVFRKKKEVDARRRRIFIDTAFFADNFWGTLYISYLCLHTASKSAASCKKPNGRQGFEGTRRTRYKTTRIVRSKGNLVLVDITEREIVSSAFPLSSSCGRTRRRSLVWLFRAKSTYCLGHNHICVVKRKMSILLIREIAWLLFEFVRNE